MSGIYLLVVAFLGVVIGVFAYIGIRQQNLVLTVNAVVSLGVAVSPVLIEWLTDWIFDEHIGFVPELYLWLSVAAVIHTIGMYGLYESTRWWDHLAHLISAGFIAAGVYASLIAFDQHTWQSIAILTIVFTFLLGVFWELLEVFTRDVSKALGKEPLLVPYGRWDTTLDLVFDLVAALLVIGLDIRVFVHLATAYPEVNELVVYVIVFLSTVGCLILSVIILLHRHLEPVST